MSEALPSRVVADMGFAALCCELDLFLSLFESLASFLIDLVKTSRATDTLAIVFALHVGVADGHTAGVAQGVGAGRQAVADGDAVIKDEALALPFTLVLIDFFEVLEDAALEVIDLGEAELFDVGGGFFASYSAGAEHGYFFSFPWDELLLGVLGEFAEAGGLWIDCAFERAELDFIVVSGIDERDVRVGEKIVPIFWLDVCAHSLSRVDVVNAHRDDLFLEPDLGPTEGHLITKGFFVCQLAKARLLTKVCKYGIDPFSRAGDGAVDAFVSQE